MQYSPLSQVGNSLLLSYAKSCGLCLSPGYRRKVFTMTSTFPPSTVRLVVAEVASLLKERKETVSVAETVGSLESLILPVSFGCSRRLTPSLT